MTRVALVLVSIAALHVKCFCQISVPTTESKSNFAFFFSRGMEQKTKGDFKSAINYFSNAYEWASSPSDFHCALSFRAQTKDILKDYAGAIADLTMLIKVDTACNNLGGDYQLRGFIKRKMRNYKGAAADSMKAESIYKTCKD